MHWKTQLPEQFICSVKETVILPFNHISEMLFLWMLCVGDVSLFSLPKLYELNKVCTVHFPYCVAFVFMPPPSPLGILGQRCT